MKTSGKISPQPVIWLMGPTSSGKTTIAEYCVSKWREQGRVVVHYDGDEVRNFFGNLHGFSKQDRLQVVRTLVDLANKASEAGVLCIVSALTAHLDAREYVRAATSCLLIGYIECSINECVRRDPKGLYALAKQGAISTLIGWSEPYETPTKRDFVLDTEKLSLSQSYEIIDSIVRGNGESSATVNSP